MEAPQHLKPLIEELLDYLQAEYSEAIETQDYTGIAGVLRQLDSLVLDSEVYKSIQDELSSQKEFELYENLWFSRGR